MVIEFDALNLSDLRKAKDALSKWSESLPGKCEEIVDKASDNLAQQAKAGYSSAISDFLMNGSIEYASIGVSVEGNGSEKTVVASGEDVLFVEFGAGVTLNGPAGSSPHAKGAQMGMTIGDYDKNSPHSLGRLHDWKRPDGERTMGTPASAALYLATLNTLDKIPQIASEVLTRD